MEPCFTQYSDLDENNSQFSAFNEDFRSSPESPVFSMCDDSMDTFSVCYDGDFEDSLDQSDEEDEDMQNEEDENMQNEEDEDSADSALGWDGSDTEVIIISD